MRSFEELEKYFQRRPIQTSDATETPVAGILTLARTDSEAFLSSSKQPRHARVQRGWFDLQVRATSGEFILLHNAVSTGRTSYGASEAFEQRIFPNMVLVGRKPFPSETRIQAISFSFVGITNFFYYDFFEHRSLHSVSKRDLQALRQFTKGKAGSRDFFRPRDLYLVHQGPKHLIKCKVDDRTYSVFGGWYATGPSSHRINVVSTPTATIKFEKPVTIDEALRYTWAWKRFFEQLSMQTLSVDRVSARLDPRTRETVEAYLPNVEETKPDIHAGYLPLNLWKERKRLAEVMQHWLARDGERRQFRLALAQIIEDSRNRIALEDVVKLCAAVESLQELDQPSPVSAKQIGVMAAAAQKVAAEQKIPIDANRIRSVLDMLQYQSLPQRLKLLAEKVRPYMPSSDLRVLMDAVRELRTTAAHGHALPGIRHPKVAPTIQALLGCCVVYDLTTSYVPTKVTGGSDLIALRDAVRGIDELQRLATP